MKLILSRHGEAEESFLTKDSERKLTTKGKSDILKMANFLFNSGIRISQIYHSPLVRTTETAKIYAEVLNLTDKMEKSDCLKPNSVYSTILPELQVFSNSDAILLIGHNPNVSYFTSELILGNYLNQSFPFQPGSIIGINIAKERFKDGMLFWFLSPDYLKS